MLTQVKIFSWLSLFLQVDPPAEAKKYFGIHAAIPAC